MENYHLEIMYLVKIAMFKSYASTLSNHFLESYLHSCCSTSLSNWWLYSLARTKINHYSIKRTSYWLVLHPLVGELRPEVW